ncbi:SUMF1/EgtB/PvdO family nonheme iron enzyme [Algibacter sp. 2305UL17-15]|uniref:formylglycine-generating enzyme family protein n=1 Tax=Algibacter sp. 2305UL17-15 TaxID=3231268 RepID=UPI003459A432
MKTKITLTLALLFCFLTNANNITVSNISLENLNEPDWVQIEFDLSWENSWRLSAGPSNWDAAWVFVKYRVNSGNWQHAQLAQTDFVAASGSTIDISSDGVGAYIYRDSDGSGDLNLQDMRLRWDYGSVNTNDVLDIQVFAIEMVYVPEGAFSVGGTSGDENSKFFNGTENISYEITSENAITVSPGSLYYNNEGNTPGDQLGPIPLDFPKGFNAFYLMKYEMSQAQFVGFFNTLTETQKTAIDVPAPIGNGNLITWSGGSSSATTTAPDRSANYINLATAMAYLDWSGLRFMTELEYEKACRGPLPPKPGEFAWGNANINATPYTIINADQPTELITNSQVGTGNALYFSTRPGGQGQTLRNGIFAASAINKNREETGGSYYGIMELSGNIWESIISIGNPAGRNYTGLHGNGSITANGSANVANWPSSGTGLGIGLRGAGYSNPSIDLRISSRRLANFSYTVAFSDVGLRGCRSF